MIFNAEMLGIEQDAKYSYFKYGQDIGPHLDMVNELREYDEKNGMSDLRQFQHVASIPEIVAQRLLTERPEVFRDSKELHKWLQSDWGKPFKVARDPKPIRGDGLQVIIK